MNEGILEKTKNYFKSDNFRKSLSFLFKSFFVVSFVIFSIIIVAIFYFTLFPSPSFSPSITDESGNFVQGSVATLESVKVGGVEQWISIRGRSKDNPILLYIHGSPGFSTMPLNRIYNSELEKNFIVVTWDQRGAGKSFSSSIPKETMTRDQLKSDANELILYLKQKFAKEKIFLAGFGFGSSLGMQLIKDNPKEYYAFVAISPSVSSKKASEITYDRIQEYSKTSGIDLLDTFLETVKRPINGALSTVQNFVDENKIIFKMCGGIRRSTDYNFFVWETINSPEYGNIYDVVGWLRGLIFSLDSMYFGAMKEVELPDEITKIDVPIYFFLGRYDLLEPTKVAEDYFVDIKAPSKNLVWFEDSAHWPNYEEPQKFYTEMYKVLKAEYK